MVLVPQRLCGRPPLRAGPPVDQRLKLLSYLHVQLHDTHVALTLAAILGSHREATVFLRLVENGKQLGFGIDHHGDALRALMSETTEPHDCSTFLQSLEYVDDGHATGYQPHYLEGEGRKCLRCSTISLTERLTWRASPPSSHPISGLHISAPPRSRCGCCGSIRN